MKTYKTDIALILISVVIISLSLSTTSGTVINTEATEEVPRQIVEVVEEVEQTPQQYAKTLAGDEWEALDYIITHESNWEPEAQNPTHSAFGLMQFITSTWSTVGCTKTSDPYMQIDCGIKYMEMRYGGITEAWEFWKENKWY